jgi:hypothetical protein
MKAPLLFLTLLILSFGHTKCAGDEDPNEAKMVFTKRSAEKPKIEPPKTDLTENVTDQTYLDYITFNDRYILDLYNFDLHIKSLDFEHNPEVEYYCPKPMFESLGLKGYLTPMLRTPDVFFCPSLKQSCCVNSDFEDMDTIWRTTYKNSILYHQSYFKYYTIGVLEQHEAIREVATQVFNQAKSDTCRNIARNILDTKVDNSVINHAKELIEKFLNFDLKLKRGFVCLFCDYENGKEFDFQTRLLNLNYEVCEEMVEHTFDFYHHFNNFVFKYINSVNFLGYCYDETDVYQTGKIRKDEDIAYIEVDNNQTNEICARAKAGGYNIFVNCLNFCSRYDLWHPKRPMYRDIELLGKIFENIRNKILKKVLIYIIDSPKIDGPINILRSKYDKFDFFNKWTFVFSGNTGVRFNHFVDMNFEDL